MNATCVTCQVLSLGGYVSVRVMTCVGCHVCRVSSLGGYVSVRVMTCVTCVGCHRGETTSQRVS